MPSTELIKVVLNFLILSTVLMMGSECKDSLVSVSVIFRNGNREPTEHEKHGSLGRLTEVGKHRLERLGEMLQHRYSKFLREEPGFFTKSTNTERTKMSLQMVLSGIRPQYNWKDWPVEIDDRNIISPRWDPTYKRLSNQLNKEDKVSKKMKKFSKDLKKLADCTGQRISTPEDMHTLYHRFMADWSVGDRLPTCTQGYFPQGELFDGVMFAYDTFSWTTEMRRINGGKFLNEFIENVKQMKKDKEKKLFLYSSHDDLLVAVMKILDIFEPHVPGYSNALVLEVYRDNDTYNVQVLYYDGRTQHFEEKEMLKKCKRCRFKDFVGTLRKKGVIP
ncbi:hypothetical protein QAD02_010891 [Eretmocerus hayati]|uniref:Uncharacterized protein n=1 Tax=Eretmocerus hayati TaxID=131215 RepID=A0ACC2NZZ9_9HYME|nr:hypothetical protein QAD02_010891 [Eretmocerus hayati]